MKKIKMRTLVAVCLVLALAAGTLTVFSLATTEGKLPTVIYDHKNKGFYFNNVEPADNEKYPNAYGNNYPNLFTSLEALMPGDKVEQEIKVGVQNVTDGYVYLYLRSYPTWEDKPGEITQAEKEAYELLAEELGLTVTLDGKEISAQMAKEGVFLGTFKNDDAQTLKVDVELDINAGNELAGLKGEIGWAFTAEYHATPTTPVGPSKPALDKGDHYAYIIGYDDGLVHPEALITRAESVTIFFRMMTEESRKAFWYQVNPYYDVFPEDWYNNAISTMTNAGIVNGYPNGNFGPMDNITRAEFATMAVRFFTDEAEDIEITEDAFPDIADSWANYEINLAYALDLVQGTPEGKFEPDREITRAEAVTIVNRVLERYPDKDHLLEGMIEWPDNMDEDMWYYADMQEATNSHEYEMAWRTVDNVKDPYEIWQTLLEVRDWAALEREWSQYNSSRNPGEVVSSRTAAVFR